MSDINDALNQFFRQMDIKSDITFIESVEKSECEVEVLDLIKLLPEITDIFKKYHGIKKEEAVNIDVITKADLEITAIVNKFVTQKFPDDLIISEEEKTKILKNPKGIVIFDPLDGSKPYAEGQDNCCFAFSRLTIDGDSLQGGWSLIWEPFNNVLTIGICGLGVFLCGISSVKNTKTVNITSFRSEKELVAYGETIIKQAFGDVEYSFMGSSSVEFNRVISDEIDVILRREKKLWDFIPGALMCQIIGKQVFYHNTNEDIFPLQFKDIIEILLNAPRLNERKLKHITICGTEEERNKICQAFGKLSQ